MNASNLVGSPKQKAYALRILQRAEKQFPNMNLLEVSNNAAFWIANRENITAILSDESNGQVVTPFSRTYPMFNREQAINAARALGDDYVVLDLETTGLKRNEDEIVEIAIVHASGVTLMDTLVKPLDLPHYLSSNARLIHEIHTEDLEVAPRFDDCVSTLVDILGTYHVVAYNASFDVPFLAYQFLRYGLPVPTIHATCAMRIFSAWMNTDTNISLENACKILKIDHPNAHRAKSDVLVTIELLKRIAAENEA